jgi:hypothetical protein
MTSAPRSGRQVHHYLPEDMNTNQPITDCDLAGDDEPHCTSTLPGCPTITCQRRPHLHPDTGRPTGLCVRVQRSPYAAAYWQAEEDK